MIHRLLSKIGIKFTMREFWLTTLNLVLLVLVNRGRRRILSRHKRLHLLPQLCVLSLLIGSLFLVNLNLF